MKNAKALVLASLLSIAGLAQADECCPATAQSTTEAVNAPVVAEGSEQVKAKKLAADKGIAADAAQENKEVVVAKE